jgi:Mn-dependent DtxR family transcriptional regulator
LVNKRKEVFKMRIRKKFTPGWMSALICLARERVATPRLIQIQLGVSRFKAHWLLKRLVKMGFATLLARGVYLLTEEGERRYIRLCEALTEAKVSQQP